MPNILDKHIDTIIDLITEGKTYRQIAQQFECSLGTVHNLLTSDEHSARANQALSISASSYADKAEQVLQEIDKDCNGIEMARARELAQHYRWKAGKRNPGTYGDRIKQDVTVTAEQPLFPDVPKDNGSK